MEEHTENNGQQLPSMDELRELILGLNPDELNKLRQWLRDRNSFSEEIANILPASVIKSIELSLPLGEALMPIIEESIFASVQNNPKALADALFPIMGPAIRKSISDTFRSLIESLNRTLENQFSPQRIKWRLQSFFSSKSYAEIVLLNSVSFTVKHVFLIHKETGLLIQDYSAGDNALESADMISSMLTAVQDFVKDSFANELEKDDHLNAIRLNDLNVWIEEGPYAILAVVFDGNAPETIRETFKETLENIHLKFGRLLKEFNGNSDSFTMLKSHLKACAVEQKKQKTNYKKPLIIFSIIVILSGIWAGFTIRDNIRWNKFIDQLSQQPGVVIINSEKKSGKYYLRGMKDVLAGNYYDLALKNKIDTAKTVFKWSNYISLENSFIIVRIKRYLPENQKVNIFSSGGKIYFEGEASSKWIEAAKEYTGAQRGYFTADFSKLKNSISDSLQKIESAINNTSIVYKRGIYKIDSVMAKEFDRIISLTRFYHKYKSDILLKYMVTPDSKGDSTINIVFAKYRLKTAGKYLKRNMPEIEIKGIINYNSEYGHRTLIFNLKKND